MGNTVSLKQFSHCKVVCVEKPLIFISPDNEIQPSYVDVRLVALGCSKPRDKDTQPINISSKFSAAEKLLQFAVCFNSGGSSNEEQFLNMLFTEPRVQGMCFIVISDVQFKKVLEKEQLFSGNGATSVNAIQLAKVIVIFVTVVGIYGTAFKLSQQ